MRVRPVSVLIMVILLSFTLEHGISQTITSLSSNSGAAGTTVTIGGSSFGAGQGTGTVSFGPRVATVNSWGDTSITVTVPSKAATGNVVVKAGSGVSSNGMLFTVLPVITDLSPISGGVGSLITIDGSSLGGSTGSVSFNGVKCAVIISWTPTSIVAPVPAGATSGNVLVTSSGGTASNFLSFTVVPPPQIAAISPSSGVIGATVVITGTNFGATQGWGGVSFNGTSAAITNWSDSGITAPVPSGASTGNIIVTANGGVLSNGVNFTVEPPTLVSLAILPSSPNLFPNSLQQFIATGTLSDGTTSDYTTRATWSSSNNSVVTVSNSNGSQGLASIETPGTSKITATVGSISGTTIVTVQTPATPVITGISPSSAVVGTQVTITGSGFGAAQGSGNVLLGSTSGTVVSWSDGQVVAAVTPGSTSGSVQVVQNFIASNSVTFTVNAPAITSIMPASGAAGTQVTIGGSGFGTAQGSGKVWLGSTYGAVMSWSDGQILATVAPSAVSGTAQVLQGGTWSNSISFFVSNNVNITGVSPASGLPGTQVTITGSGFGNVQGSGNVWLGSAYGAVVNWADAQVVANVAPGATSGMVQVLQNGVLSNSVSFTVNNPQITSISPTSGADGTAVTITGSGFGTSQGSGIVWLGSVAGLAVTWSDAQIVATVAPNAVGGIVRIQQNGIWSNAVSFIVPPSSGSDPSVVISPNVMSMLAGDTRSLRAADSSGKPITGLTWASSDATIATLSTDDPPVLTAVAPGHVTITAGNASADLTVYAGQGLPLGTAQWSLPDDGSGFFQILPAVPSDNGIADVFAVQGDGNAQAIAIDGTVAWTATLDPASSKLLPDFQRGLIVVDSPSGSGQPPHSIKRFDGVTGAPSPAYNFQNPPTSGSSEIRPVRVFTDGTILAVDGDQMVGIDPNTMLPKFTVALDDSVRNLQNTCGRGGDGSSSFSPPTQSFIIAGDGYAYLAYQNTVEDDIIDCSTADVIDYTFFKEHTKVLRVGPAGDWSSIPVNDFTDNRRFDTVSELSNEVKTGYNATATGLITNADQGVVLPLQLHNSAYCMSAAGPCFPDSSSFNLTQASSGGGVSQVSLAIPGQATAVTPMLQAADGTFIGTVGTGPSPNNVTQILMIGFDLSENLKLSVPNYTPLRATPDGVIAQSADGLTTATFDQSGNVAGQLVRNGAVMSWSGNWYNTDGVGMTSYALAPVTLDSSFWPELDANPSANGTGNRFTKEITIIGWINEDLVTFPPTSSVSSNLFTALSDRVFLCPGVAAALSIGNRSLITSDVDRRYANAFFIANSANHEPPPKLDASVLTGGDFRAYNRVQAVIEPIGNQILSAQFYDSKAALGDTPDPCHSPLTPIGNLIVGGGLFKPEAHPDNGKQRVTPGRAHAFQLAEGRVGVEAQAANRTLNACFSTDAGTGFCNDPVPPVTPYIWSFPLFDFQGQYTVNTQEFPTYYVYEDRKLVNKIPQSALENFLSLNAQSQIKASDIK